MRVEMFRGLASPIVLEGVTRVLVLDDDGVTPLALLTIHANATVVSTAADANFSTILRAFGVDRTVIASEIDVRGGP